MLGRIALDLNSDTNLRRRLSSAIQLAVHHQAELVGIYTNQLTPQYIYDDAVVPAQVLTSMKNYISEEKHKTKELFLKEVNAAGVQAHWRVPEGPSNEALALHARFCDLLIMSQADEPESAGSLFSNFAESVITAAGRPVLMIPYIGELPQPLGQRVLFCWDYGRRAARALADAAPILKRASELVVLTVDPDPELLSWRDISPNDLAAYCASHQYPKIKERHTISAGVGVGNAILNTAADNSCDLIVMGAYNHSRLREWMLGGASKTLLQSMTVPILFSH